jgi:L-lysine 6-transaminase
MVRFGREMEIVEEEGLMENARLQGQRLAAGLQEIVSRHSPTVFNVRGLGLYQGVSFDTAERRSQAIETAREEFDLLLLGAGNRSLRTRPAASVTSEEVDRFLDQFDQVVARVRG